MGFRVRIMFSIFFLFAVSIGVLLIASMKQITDIVSEDYARLTKSKLKIINLQIDNHYKKLQKSGLEKLYSDGYKKLKLQELKGQYRGIESSEELIIFDTEGEHLIDPLGIDLNTLTGLQTGGGTLNYSVNGKDWILVYEFFEPWQWYVGFTVAKADKMAAVDIYIKKLALLLVAYMFIFLMILYLLLQLITSPLKKFSEEVTHMRTEGKYSRVSFGHKDELEQLSEAFNKLVEHQANYADDLKREVDEQTATIREQQVKLVTSANLSALGEMAGTIAHEINNP